MDITGASMNDGVSSHAGIPRSAFPSNVSTFSGHFHKPHTVGDGFIRYVGSPYQVRVITIALAGVNEQLFVVGCCFLFFCHVVSMGNFGTTPTIRKAHEIFNLGERLDFSTTF